MSGRRAVVGLALVIGCGGTSATAGDPLDAGADAGSDGAGGSDGSGGPDGTTDGGLIDGALDGSDAAAFSPKKLPGLSLWLDDTVGVVIDPAKPGRVKRWLDQSGNGNDATGEGGDGVTTSPALDPAAVGGKDAVMCDLQTILTIPSVASLKFGTGDFGIVMVAKTGTLSPGPISLYRKTEPTGIELAVTQSAELELRAVGVGGGVAKVAGVADDKFVILSARGAALDVRAGSASATGPTSTADLSGDNSPITLCQSSINSKPEIAEVIVVKGKLSDADLAATVAYLKAKFGL